MQQFDLPAIQFIIHLYWTVELCWWQSDRIVCSLLKFKDVVAGSTCAQVLRQHSTDWHNSVDDWAIDGAHSFVRMSCGRVQQMLDVRSSAIGYFLQVLGW